MRAAPTLLALLAAAAILSAPLASRAQQAPTQALDADQPIEINADSLEVQQESQVAIFRGNVDAVQGRIRLQAEELQVHYRNGDGGDGGAGGAMGGNITRIDALGDVRVSSPTETARGERGVFEVAQNQIVLSGNVVLTREENVIRGERLVLDLTSGVSRVEAAPGSRVRGVFVPPRDNEPSGGEQPDDGQPGGGQPAADAPAEAGGAPPDE